MGCGGVEKCAKPGQNNKPESLYVGRDRAARRVAWVVHNRGHERVADAVVVLLLPAPPIWVGTAAKHSVGMAIAAAAQVAVCRTAYSVSICLWIRVETRAPGKSPPLSPTCRTIMSPIIGVSVRRRAACSDRDDRGARDRPFDIGGIDVIPRAGRVDLAGGSVEHPISFRDRQGSKPECRFLEWVKLSCTLACGVYTRDCAPHIGSGASRDRLADIAMPIFEFLGPASAAEQAQATATPMHGR